MRHQKTEHHLSTDDRDKLSRLARDVLALEASAVAALGERIDDRFVLAAELMLACAGRIVVTGMGKSGHIGGKIAATLASTGTPAFFVHPGEASHGDLGMITTDDVVLALSNSGETDEITHILPLIKRLNVPLVAMTGNPASTLARMADAHLDVSVAKEACPLGLAPTASTTAALAMGDALAVSLLEARGFTAEDFARSHPGGKLGRRLLLRVDDVMRRDGQLPLASPDQSLGEVLLIMSRGGLGFAVITDADQTLRGVFTDGDLRRVLDRGGDIRDIPVAEVMTSPCRFIGADALAAEALGVMEEHKINGLPVVAAGKVVGAFNMHDLLRAGVA